MLLPALQLLAISHVTVIDMTGAAPRPDMTVVVSGSRIQTLGSALTTRIPPRARMIDGHGRYLIPGLWDMHVHTDIPGGGGPHLGMYIANGVTSVRDLGGTWATIHAWRDSIDTGTLVGPRLFASGPYLNGVPVPVAHFDVHNAAQARAAVDSLASLGTDLVKIHSRVPRDAVFAALREARAKHMRTGGHVSYGVTVEEVSDSGQGSLEHVLGFINQCTPAESLRFAGVDPFIRIVFNGCTSRDQTPVYRHLARNGTWVTPTFSAQYEFAILPSTRLAADSLAHYVPDTLRHFWRESLNAPTNLPKSAEALGRALFQKRLRMVGEMHRAGVPLLAGTDAPLRNSTPGFGLHEELRFMVAAGLSPLEALRTATWEPARWFGALDSLGTIGVGKVADLVLLDANPLVDIGNTRRIDVVITRGRVYDAVARRALLAAAERAARENR